MIGIICALQEELQEILIFMKKTSETILGGCTFITGNLFGSECVAALCGVGKVHAAMCAQTMIINYKPDFIINMGVAGSFEKNIKTGDIVVADAVIQHDFDVSAFPNRKKGEISGIDKVAIPCSKWITNKILVCSQNLLDFKVHTGTVLSGDRFINSVSSLYELKEEFGGCACEMEAGGIGQVCYVNHTDFAVIRAISDCADGSSAIDFDAFVKKSSKNAANILSEFIKSYQD